MGVEESHSRRPPWRFQFTIARIMACTLLVALAAWVATVKLPIGLTLSLTGDRNLLPFLLTTLLLAAAAGALIQGKPGAREGVRIGCGVLIAAALLASVGLTLIELWHWIARIL